MRLTIGLVHAAHSLRTCVVAELNPFAAASRVYTFAAAAPEAKNPAANKVNCHAASDFESLTVSACGAGAWLRTRQAESGPESAASECVCFLLTGTVLAIEQLKLSGESW